MGRQKKTSNHVVKSLILSKQEIIDRGYNQYSIDDTKFREELKASKDYIVYYDPRYKYWFFYDLKNREMIKVNNNRKFTYKRISRDEYRYREFCSKTKRGVPYDRYFYRVYGMAIDIYKLTDEPVWNQNASAEKVARFIDRKLQQDAQ